MLITKYSKLASFSDTCGAEIPRWIQKQLEAYGNDSESIVKVGEELVSDLTRKLLEQGSPGIHFYTMNQAEASLAIWNNIK
ncbi:MAG: methylenetetrahydrofolate reductase (NADPH) [Colwellia sp.]|jgi:methylenetetrahydrofolate reductase (NADPH)